MRNRRKNKIRDKIVLLVVLLLGLGLGYALLSQDLTISGISKVRGNEWDIHFENVQVNGNSVTLSDGDSAAAINASDDTLVEYTVTLNLPGDFYEFTVDAVNEGTVDGMIGGITFKLNDAEISSENPMPAYLSYFVAYEDGTEIDNNHLLEAGHSETIKVRLEFRRDIENNELPATLQTNSFSFGISYVQRTSSAIPVPHPDYFYAINVGDMNDLENTSIVYGSAVPNTITTYSSKADVIAALNTQVGGTMARPLYVKYLTENDIVTAGYIEFIVTNEIATANPGMTAGTYTLQGGGTSQEYNSEYDEYYFVGIPYETNKEVLDTAFGSSNCYENADEGQYTCSAGGFNVTVDMYGYVSVDISIWASRFTYEGFLACFGNPKPITGTVYALGGHDNMIQLGMMLPFSVPVFGTGAEARAEFSSRTNKDLHSCLKHTLSDSVVMESYVEFVITSTMVNSNPSMTAGTYTLRGDTTGAYYSSNMAAMQTAFGSAACTSSSEGYFCDIGSSLHAYCNLNGEISFSEGYSGCTYSCSVRSGVSECSSWC